MNLLDFNTFSIDKFTDTDWQLCTDIDGFIDLECFLILVNKKLNIQLTDSNAFQKSILIILQLERLLGPFSKDQAIAVAIHYCLSK
jgi:hypothetical protein